MRVRPIFVLLLAIAVVLTAAIAGCNALVAGLEGDSADVVELHEAVRSLVPAGAAVVAERESGCYRVVGRYPDCVLIFFNGPASLTARLDALEALAAAGGWAEVARHVGDGGTMVRYTRNGLHANVSLDTRGYFWRQHCRRGALDHYEREHCADSVQVRFD